MWPDTFELFEFNKMWMVFGFSLVILFLWGSKMIILGKFEIRRTPLDIPIALFLVSQVISTIVSIEPYVSFWGYYSRFNGGLLSTVAYIFLYYAFATNLVHKSEHEKDNVSYKILVVSLLSGLAVTLWGLPSHFGSDLTCLFFRGTLDTSCWTEQFQPTVRMFSTMGQPNWLGTLLAAIIPVTISFGIYKTNLSPKKFLWPGIFLGLTLLFYIAIIFANSQSSYLGLVAGLAVFFIILAFRQLRNKKLSTALIKEAPIKFEIFALLLFILVTFFFGSPVLTINKYATLSGIRDTINRNLSKATQPTAQPQAQNAPQSQAPAESFSANPSSISGGTESSKIRLVVWQGAIELFKRHPLFGTGVETYAYAYYNVKPLAHNLTSEWDYLYNKAHNEYLNYLATTGAFGLGSYLLIIGFFFFYVVRDVIRKEDGQFSPIPIGIAGGYSAILVSNFFGFSVVPINLLFFMFPIIYFGLTNEKLHSFAVPKGETTQKTTPVRMTFVVILGLVCLYYEFFLLNFWSADRKYALGYNLDKIGEYPQAYIELSEAVKMLPQEDLYKDEFSVNMATLALLLSQNNRASEAAQMGQTASALSDELIARHPKNIVFYKTRVRVQYALSQLDPAYLDAAIETAKQAMLLAPTDAKLSYNIALIYIEKKDTENATAFLDETLKMKPNYVDPRYAKAVLYADLAKENPQRAAEYKKIAKDELEYLLKNVYPGHTPSQDLLKTL
jgi:tetratricopeptide (TPR) repeat protein